MKRDCTRHHAAAILHRQHKEIRSMRETQKLLAELGAVRESRDKLQAFKDYVHKTLDEMGVPPDPDPELTAVTGCRIGHRLTWIQHRLRPKK